MATLQEIEDDFYRILDLYQDKTGRADDIVTSFVCDLENGGINGQRYFPELADNDSCGCFHHSAMEILGVLDAAVQSVQGLHRFTRNPWTLSKKVNDVLGFDIANSDSPFEKWLAINFDPPVVYNMGAAAYIVQWVKNWREEQQRG